MYIGAEIPDIKSVAPSGVIKRDDKGLAVKLVQEWLTLHGFYTGIDDDFGPATVRTVKAFQHENHMEVDGVVGKRSWDALWTSMRKSLMCSEWTATRDGNFGLEVLSFAWTHLTNNAHELGQNQGPWVRLFFSRDPVNGLDGPEFSWCSAFVRFCIEQALTLLKRKPVNVWDYKIGWSCDNVANWAIKAGLFHEDANPDTVKPGSVFLIKKSEHDWVHTGFVESYDHNEGVITTIEGNTNDGNSREGVAVMRRYRSVKNLNFITGYGTEPKAPDLRRPAHTHIKRYSGRCRR